MVANTNRLIAWVKLIPRDKYEAETNKDQDNRFLAEFGEQKGAPFGLYRTVLFSPSSCLAMLRLGERPRQLIYFPASRFGMFPWAR